MASACLIVGCVTEEETVIQDWMSSSVPLSYVPPASLHVGGNVWSWEECVMEYVTAVEEKMSRCVVSGCVAAIRNP